MQEETLNKRKGIRQVFTQPDRKRNQKQYNQEHSKRNRRKTSKGTAHVNFLATTRLSSISSLQYDHDNSAGLFEESSDIIHLIACLYPIVRDDISIFLHTKTFTEDSCPFDFLEWMLRCYEDINPDINWEVNYNGEDWFIAKHRDYDDIGEQGRSVEIDWMEILRFNDKELYNLFVALFSLWNNVLRIPFYFDAENHVYALEFIEGEMDYLTEEYDEQEAAEYRDRISTYIDGAAFTIGNEIKECKTTHKTLLKGLKSYKPKTKKQKFAYKFLVKAVKLLDHEVTFGQFVYLSQEEGQDSYPATPYEYAMIGWTFDESDPLANHIEEQFSSTYNEYGAVCFRDVEYNGEISDPHPFVYDYVDMLDDMLELSTKMQGA